MRERSREHPLYPRRPGWVQLVCPAPKRYLQELIRTNDLRTGLDIGCGEGSPLAALRARGFRSTGIDIYSENIASARARSTHDEYLLGDFRTAAFPGRFDVVVLSHVIEHFTRDEGEEVLRQAESLATRLVYVETPNGFLEQLRTDRNPFERHLSGWFPHDFEARGYTVFGSGPRFLRSALLSGGPVSGPLSGVIGRALQRWYFRRPVHAAIIAAIRLVDEGGNVRRC
ncbi:MAG TPA: class I SAM-dependent methyltransferase [Thermoanaerobaculaceae bacterium]|nr:class I SAM-dependent methyltransferase [Thermoanaerobaculaceae bacterium]